jgi:hypothetical protein
MYPPDEMPETVILSASIRYRPNAVCACAGATMRHMTSAASIAAVPLPWIERALVDLLSITVRPFSYRSEGTKAQGY